MVIPFIYLEDSAKYDPKANNIWKSCEGWSFFMEFWYNKIIEGHIFADMIGKGHTICTVHITDTAMAGTTFCYLEL